MPTILTRTASFRLAYICGPVRERVLSTRGLNRALLARQLLLDRSRLPLTRAVDQVGGLQTQYAPSAYVALWSRLSRFRREDLTRALEQRRVVQATLLRTTIHVVSAREFHLFAAGIRRSRQEWWLRIHRTEMDRAGMDAVSRRLRRHLANGPLRATELTALLADDGFPPAAWSGAGLWVDMVRVPPSGTWERRRADLFGLAEDWIGPSTATEAEGLAHLVRRYLGGFGPATPADIARWAAVPAAKVEAVVERARLRRVRTEDGTELVDLPRAPLPDPAAPAPVRFIPTWEAMLLVHARRTQVLPERYRDVVFNTKTPHSVPTFLVDGAVAGSWKHESGRIRLEPFEPLPRAVRRDLEDEARGLAAFHAG
jgi:Winged helix DNA-binding domain